MLQIFATKPSSAQENMDMDARLLEGIVNSLDPFLRFHNWSTPQVFTYGHFTRVESLLNFEEIQKRKIQTAKRPTGGGVVYHGTDLSFSFLLPSSNAYFSSDALENYRFVNDIVKNALSELFGSQSMDMLRDLEKAPKQTNFCMEKPTIYDVFCEEKEEIAGKEIVIRKKIVGAAQRKKKTGYLHQGTISLAKPDEEFLSATLLSEKNIRDAILSYSYAPLQGKWTEEDLNDLRYKVRLLLIRHFREALDNPLE